MCGHATLAGVHTLIEAGRWTPDKSQASATVRIETLSGLLTAFVEPLPGRPGRRMIWLELRPPRLEDHAVNRSELAGVLRIAPDAFEPSLPVMQTQDEDLIVLVKNMADVHGASPDFGALATWLSRERVRGLSLATVNTVTPSISVQSRFFCPSVGIDEDPVTGSVHGPLAAYLVRHGLVPVHDGMAGFMAVQGKPGGRCGLVSALVRVDDGHACSVRIGGEAITTMRGVLITPAPSKTESR